MEKGTRYPNHLRVLVDGHELQIPLGHCRQSIRWLAATAVTRATALRRPNGALRATSISDDFDRTTIATAVQVVETNEVLGPNLSLHELIDHILLSGPEALAKGVRIVVGGREDPTRTIPAPYEKDGASTADRPARPSSASAFSKPLWASLAYNYSKGACDATAASLEVHRGKMMERAERLKREAEEEEKVQMERLGRLLVSDSDDPDALDRAFNNDWAPVRVHLVSNDGEALKKIRRDAFTGYLGLMDAFTHFSGGGARGSLYTMERMEFQHFLVLAKVMDVVQNRVLITKCFDKAKAGRAAPQGGGEGDPDSLVRYEFVEALLYLAAEKFGRETDSKSGAELGPAHGWSKLLNEKVQPLVAKLNAGPVRAAMRHPDMHKFLLPRLPSLLVVFDWYAALDAQDHAGAVAALQSARESASKGTDGVLGAIQAKAHAHDKRSSLLDLSEFIRLLEDSGLLDDVTLMSHGNTSGREAAAHQLKNTRATLTAQEVRETFSAVQREEDGSGLALMDSKAELSFGEFLEAVGRVALAKWADTVGLKYAVDPRQVAGKAPQPPAASDMMVRIEQTLVRSLIMWAFLAVLDVKERLGQHATAPVQYSTGDLVRQVAMGSSDVEAAMRTRGAMTASAIAAAMFEAQRAAAEKARSVIDVAGLGMTQVKRKVQPKNPFGTAVIGALTVSKPLAEPVVVKKIPPIAVPAPVAPPAAAGKGGKAAAKGAPAKKGAPAPPALPKVPYKEVVPRPAPLLPLASNAVHGHTYGLGVTTSTAL